MEIKKCPLFKRKHAPTWGEALNQQVLKPQGWVYTKYKMKDWKPDPCYVEDAIKTRK